MANYLNGRSQIVHVSKCESDDMILQYVVNLQGSVLGPGILSMLRTCLVSSHYIYFGIICLLTPCSATTVDLLVNVLRWLHEFKFNDACY